MLYETSWNTPTTESSRNCKTKDNSKRQSGHPDGSTGLVDRLWNSEGLRGVYSNISHNSWTSADIITLTETLALAVLTIPGMYHAYCAASKAPGPSRPSGGVSILYNYNVIRPQTLLSEDDCVILAASPIYYCEIYVRPHPVETTECGTKPLDASCLWTRTN